MQDTSQVTGETHVEIGRDVWAVADTARKALAEEQIPSRLRETQDVRRSRTLHAVLVPKSFAEVAEQAADGLL
jgi:hypothetical protein